VVRVDAVPGGIAAARARTARVDALIGKLADRLPPHAAAVALGAYGRAQLTPHSEPELLFLHRGDLSSADATQLICYPLWEQAIHVEPFVRTVDECAADARRSWSAMSRFLDARFVAGDPKLFEDLHARMQPFRRDRDGLRHRLRSEAEQRHSTHPSATASNTPDLVAGRGGLMDLQALHWLDLASDERTIQALDFLLASIEAAETLTGHTTHRLSADILCSMADPQNSLLPELYAHARWVAFRLDGALAPARDDRQLGNGLAVRDNELIADRSPPLERAPSFGLRIANLVGLAAPAQPLLEWACRPGPPLAWEESALDQLWLLLRAADWRAWDFLDVSGLLLRYFPEFGELSRKPGSATTGELAFDAHTFLALRRLHEVSESEDQLVRRAWRAAHQRDAVYLAVLLHELSPDAAAAAVRRLALPAALGEAIGLTVSTYQTVLDTATRRDLHDEDLVLELATRIGTRQRLGMLFLVAVAHEMACGAQAWSPWKANLVRQMFGTLESALRQPSEVGARRTRALEQQRERIVRALYRRNLYELVPLVARLPRRYVLTRPPEQAARHLSLLERGPLAEGEVRIQPSRHRQPGMWDLLLVARDRPGLLATLAGVLALRGASVLAADAATSSDGLVLDVFTVSSAQALQWPVIEKDLQLALDGRIPLHDLLGSRALEPADAAAIHVAVDNSASQFFSVVEVRAPDQVGLLYRIANALHVERLDIQHARITTHPDGAFDVFYVRDPNGAKLSDVAAENIAESLTARLRGEAPVAMVPSQP
jgi:[protein-PII] uridylyltransferase